MAIAAVALVGLAGYLHFLMRKLSARTLRRSLASGKGSSSEPQIAEWIAKAFERNVSPRRVAIGTEPVGWGRLARNKVTRVLADADKYIQELNSRFTDPSGSQNGNHIVSIQDASAEVGGWKSSSASVTTSAGSPSSSLVFP